MESTKHYGCFGRGSNPLGGTTVRLVQLNRIWDSDSHDMGLSPVPDTNITGSTLIGLLFKRPGQEPGRCRFESCLPDKYVWLAEWLKAAHC